MAVPGISHGSIRSLAALILSSLDPGRGASVTTITRTKWALRTAGVAAVIASAAISIGLASAQAPAVSVDVSECVKLTTPEERLACFEAQVQNAGNAPAPAASGSETKAAEFGEAGDQEPDVQEIEARITDLRETVPHAYVITLDNGQVWRQTVPKNYGLREGIPVRIYYSRWRAYRLTNDQLKSFIQVERVR